jgi:hypothetical protein
MTPSELEARVKELEAELDKKQMALNSHGYWKRDLEARNQVLEAALRKIIVVAQPPIPKDPYYSIKILAENALASSPAQAPQLTKGQENAIKSIAMILGADSEDEPQAPEVGS